MASVVLGVAGNLVTPQEIALCSYHTTKAGGQPCLPLHTLSKEQLKIWNGHQTCSTCGEGLSLVLQAYAPLSITEHGTHCPERILLLLACLHPRCGKLPTSWRLLRIQRPAASHVNEAAASEGTSVQRPALAEQHQHPIAVADDTRTTPAASATGRTTHIQPAVPMGYGDVGGFDDFGDEAQDENPGADITFTVQQLSPDSSLLPHAAHQSRNSAAGVSVFDLSDLDAALNNLDVQTGHSGLEPGRQQQQQTNAGKETDISTSMQDAGTAGCKQSAAAVNDPSMAANGGSLHVLCDGPELPAFYVLAVEEPSGQHRSSAAQHSGTGDDDDEDEDMPVRWRPDELAHVKGLLQRYQEQEDEESAAAVAPHASSQRTAATTRNTPSAAAQAGGGDSDSDGEGEGKDGGGEGGMEWAKEDYEKDAVRGVEASYLQFSKRLLRSPQQCVRYSRSGQLLWPLSRPPASPPPCTRCGAPRVFEFQLMAPILAMFLECGEWLEPEDLPRHSAAICSAANMDLVTVAAFTCSASCTTPASDGVVKSSQERGVGEGNGQEGDSRVVIVEEFLMLVNEDECHRLHELSGGAAPSSSGR